jgi:hypothetical protein
MLSANSSIRPPAQTGMACSGSRVARLKLDLSELLASPYPGVSIVLDDSNVHNFCLHLCPDSGPWKGLRLHFDVELPDEVRFICFFIPS